MDRLGALSNLASRRLPPLPIDVALPDILACLAEGTAVVVIAPPGTGKTTRLPQTLLDGGLLGTGSCMVLEPRRIAARAAARRVSEERGTVVGAEVGYVTRFDRRVSRESRILFATDGILLARLQSDPLLEGVSAVVLDEFHERSLEVDLALGFLREIRSTVRPDLLLAVLSATLDPGPVAEYLGARVVRVSGRNHPVEVSYDQRTDARPLPQRCAAAVRQAWKDGAGRGGGVLAFLPGAGEIRRTGVELESWARESEIPILPLHGDLPAEAQDAALRLPADGSTRVVLATNVAETSITVEGVRAVVDTGLVKVLRHEPSMGLDRLELLSISRQSADQRAGRAGRLGPGRAYRLWTRHEDLSRPERGTPEIHRIDLCGALLEILGWGARSDTFPWFEAPPPERVAAAQELLIRLSALDADGRLTALGETLRRVPLHPRLGRMLVEAGRLGVLREGAALAAMLSERDILLSGRTIIGVEGRGAGGVEAGVSDLLHRLELLEKAEAAGFDAARLRVLGVDPGASRSAAALRDRLVASPALREGASGGSTKDGPWEDRLLRVILAGYPDRVARRRSPGSDHFLLTGGRGAVLSRDSAVTRAELIVAVQLDGGRRGERSEARIRLASRIELDWLDEVGTVETLVETRFDEGREKVAAVETRRYGDLPLSQRNVAPDPEEAARLLAEASARDPEGVLRPGKEAKALLSRCRFLARTMPDLGLPGWGPEDWTPLLENLCRGRATFEELRRQDLAAALRRSLPVGQLHALDRFAPERIEVPSGSRIALHYEEEGPPVLAVKIQEVFGWSAGPRVANGQVPVLIHLLGPNGRPLQVTSDLESFWRSGYSQVRKEMRGRYPKHRWPEDPWSAVPSRRTTKSSADRR